MRRRNIGNDVAAVAKERRPGIDRVVKKRKFAQPSSTAGLQRPAEQIAQGQDCL
jgi:hypothetical protein